MKSLRVRILDGYWGKVVICLIMDVILIIGCLLLSYGKVCFYDTF